MGIVGTASSMTALWCGRRCLGIEDAQQPQHSLLAICTAIYMAISWTPLLLSCHQQTEPCGLWFLHAKHSACNKGTRDTHTHTYTHMLGGLLIISNQHPHDTEKRGHNKRTAKEKEGKSTNKQWWTSKEEEKGGWCICQNTHSEYPLLIIIFISPRIAQLGVQFIRSSL